MPQGNITRRLAAILAADVVGYSRLMGANEIRTLEALKAHRKQLVDPAIGGHHGRIVKTAGDGMLVEFSSVVDAVSCAVAVQRGMAARNADTPKEERIEFRIGINVGDIIIDDDDIFGDGVNVAARLETLCEPGGLCISRTANDQIRDKLAISFADLGEQTVKNISRAVGVFGLGADEIASLAEEDFPSDREAAESAGDTRPEVRDEQQEIRFCISPDGTQIAYATVGSGPWLVKAPNWMSHLEYEWQSPIWRHLLDELAKDHALVRFDQRGNGLSDWEVEDISFDAFVSDMETVVDSLRLKRFPLLGVSQGCAISIAYAVRHPERVSRLVLYGGFARGLYKRDPTQKEQAEAMLTLIRHGWGKDNPAFRQMFTSSFIPGGTLEQMEWFNELQKVSASAQNAVRLREATSNFEISDLLSKVSVPTLVLHCRDDAIVPFNEGRRMAAMIPGARFVPLEGRNHLILEHEPVWTRFLSEVRNFLDPAR
jgi:class 3 adenylate cyclase/pimeloyl-ACP methyl ester carboxylesterase